MCLQLHAALFSYYMRVSHRAEKVSGTQTILNLWIRFRNYPFIMIFPDGCAVRNTILLAS
jgi:hypothetical protein